MAESFLKDIGLYKGRISGQLLDSPEICEVLLGENYTEEQVDELLYSQMFPYLYVDETQTEVLPYICFEVTVPTVPTHTVKCLQLTIWAYCHKECMKYSKKGYSGTRADIMADMVERCLRDSERFGIGKLEFKYTDVFSPANKYYGRKVIFYAYDFKLKEAK